MADPILFKFIIVGDSRCGKSCLMSRFTDSTFSSSSESTIGIDFSIHTVSIRGIDVKLQIWDLAGHLIFRTIIRSYYKQTSCAVLVYDVTNRESFDNVSSWLQEVTTHSNNKHSVIVVVGTQCDKAEKERQVSYEEGQQFANENGWLFFEASAKTGHNVDDVFLQSADEVYWRILVSTKQKILLTHGYIRRVYDDDEVEKIPMELYQMLVSWMGIYVLESDDLESYGVKDNARKSLPIPNDKKEAKPTNSEDCTIM